MYPALLQDWLTLRGTASSNVTQGELAWLDTSAFLDLVTWTEVADLEGGTFYCAFQTAPTKDESLFTGMNIVGATTPGSVALAQGVQVGVYLRDTAQCPLSHWLRWQIQPPATTPWTITFRIWVSANQPGGLARAIADGEAGAYAGGPAWTPGGGPVGGNPSAPGAPPLVIKGTQQHAASGQKYPGGRFGYAHGTINATRPLHVSPTAPPPTQIKRRGFDRWVQTTMRVPSTIGAVNPKVPKGSPQE